MFVAVYLDGGARVFGTVDHGSNWFEVTGAPVPTVQGFPWGHAAFAVTANRLYLSGVNLSVASFSSFILGSLIFQSVPGMPTDRQCAVPDPTETDAVLFCSDKGVYRFSAQQNTPTSLNATLGVTQVYRMDVHPRHRGLISLGAQDLRTHCFFPIPETNAFSYSC